ncbi:MAG: hypothetical protein M1839_003309 [Geoglossum umbratile]|nr:MAG: hypothetical protein M1839_003309 [Geoglossum umbratile]
MANRPHSHPKGPLAKGLSVRFARGIQPQVSCARHKPAVPYSRKERDSVWGASGGPEQPEARLSDQAEPVMEADTDAPTRAEAQPSPAQPEPELQPETAATGAMDGLDLLTFANLEAKYEAALAKRKDEFDSHILWLNRERDGVRDAFEREKEKMQEEFEREKGTLNAKVSTLQGERNDRERDVKVLRRQLDVAREEHRQAINGAINAQREQQQRLEAQIFELAGGIGVCCDGDLVETYKTALADISLRVPGLFGIPDLDNESHRQALAEFASQRNINPIQMLEEFGDGVWSSLCEMWVFDAIWSQIQRTFCVGTNDVLAAPDNPPTVDVEEALRVIESAGLKRFPVTRGKSDVVAMWRSHTVRLLLMLSDVDLKQAAEAERKEKHFYKLRHSIDEIVSRAIASLQQIYFQDQLGLSIEKHHNTISKRMLSWTVELVFLYLNTRLSRTNYDFPYAQPGTVADPERAQCVQLVAHPEATDGDDELTPGGPSSWLSQNSRAEQPLVKLPIFPEFCKRSGSGEETLLRAKVILHNAEMRPPGRVQWNPQGRPPSLGRPNSSFNPLRLFSRG